MFLVLCTNLGLLFSVLLPFRFTIAQHTEFDHEYRLPTHLTPIIYDLKLILSSYREEVRGRVVIQLQCENATDFIELHANSMFIFIENATLENRLLGEKYRLDFPTTDSIRQIIRFSLPLMLEKRHVYYLDLQFTTKYSFDERGLVRSQDTLKGTWFNTLFEPSHARRLFPGFDEPRWRSSFKLELHLEGEYSAEDMVALSCMDDKEVTRAPNLTIWSFFPTPPIPTYIFTVAAGRLRSVCNATVLHGKEICIWRFTHWENWELMAQVIIQAIARFQGQITDYLLSDPIARLHFLIAPSKLKGMENFGLLNIGERLWPTKGDKRSLQLFSKTLYHEITHQWFGNLVTVKNWEDIWLSESLTTFLSSFKPLEVDLQSDRSSEALINSKWIGGIPSISYTKGPVFLEMLNSIIGAKRMRRLLREYLRIHQFGYATTESFLNVLENVTADQQSNETVAPVDFMNAWLYQGGYPIVFVDYDPKVHQFVLTQTPKLHSNNQTAKTEWPIPIWTSCAIQSVEERLHWIRPGKNLALNLIDLTETLSKNAVVFNPTQIVYYKLVYRY